MKVGFVEKYRQCWNFANLGNDNVPYTEGFDETNSTYIEGHVELVIE